MATVRLSKKYTLAAADFVRGALLSVGTSVLMVLQQSLQEGRLDFNWKVVATTAVSTLVAYILKNFLFEPAKVITTADTNLKAEKANEKIKDVVTQP